MSKLAPAIATSTDPAEVQTRLDAASESLTRCANLFLALSGIAKNHTAYFAKDEFQRAINAASENLGIACALYSDVNDELNAVTDAMD